MSGKLLVLLFDHRNFKSPVSLSYGYSLQLQSLQPLQTQKAKRNREGGTGCVRTPPWVRLNGLGQVRLLRVPWTTRRSSLSVLKETSPDYWWRTGKPGVLQSTGSQRVEHDWATELNWTELNFSFVFPIYKIRDGIGKHLISEDHMFPRKHWELLIPKVEKEKIRWEQNNKCK